MTIAVKYGTPKDGDGEEDGDGFGDGDGAGD